MLHNNYYWLATDTKYLLKTEAYGATIFLPEAWRWREAQEQYKCHVVVSFA